MVTKSGSTVIGKKPAKVIVKLKRSGSPTGNITVKIRNGIGYDGPVLHTFTDTLSAASVSTSSSGTNYTFTSPTNTVAMSTGYSICVEYTGSSSSSNYIKIYVNSGNVVNNNNLITHGTGNSNPDDETGQDFAGTIYEVTV